MQLIKPEDCWKLEIPEIDAQHEGMISLINRIHETMLQKADKPTLDGLLAQLMEVTRNHCAYEEQLMSQYGYPGYEAHQAEHARLLQHLAQLIERYSEGDLLLSFAVVIELKGWACIHIEKSDERLANFLKSRPGFGATPDPPPAEH